MKSAIFIKIGLLLLLAIFIIAPFTFLKPNLPEQLDDDLSAEQRAKKKEQQVIKKVIEKPLHNVILPDFGAILDIQTKKKTFFDFMKPSVIKQNNQLRKTRKKLNSWLENITLELPLTEQEHQ